MSKYSREQIIGMAAILVAAKIQGDPRFPQFVARLSEATDTPAEGVHHTIAKILTTAQDVRDLNYQLALRGISERTGWTWAQIEQEIAELGES